MKSHRIFFDQCRSERRISMRACLPGPRALVFGGAITAALIGLSATLSADNSQPITRIEEDWQITFGAADPDLNAPQVTMTVSPTNSLAGHYAVFEINHQTQPDYFAGGLQLQRWWGDTCFDFKSSHKQGVMRVDNDVVNVTLSMQVQNGALTFGVSNGNSQSWGTFGGSHLTLTTPYERSDLSTYDPTTSVANSRVGFASNRVQQLMRTQVRYYSNNTLVSTDSTKQIVPQYDGQ